MDYKNCYDETVKTEIYAILDAFEAFEPENGVQEIYSKLINDAKDKKYTDKH